MTEDEHSKQSPLGKIQVKVLLDFLEKSLEEQSNEYLFEPNVKDNKIGKTK